MKSKSTAFSQRYQKALRLHLKPGAKGGAQAAAALGTRATEAGLDVTELVTIHDNALMFLMMNGTSALGKTEIVRRSGRFLSAAVRPIGKSNRLLERRNTRLEQSGESLKKRTRELERANGKLSREVSRREVAEASLKSSEARQTRQLAEATRMQAQLRSLSHQLLSAHEAERKEISRELHDQIAQTLTGINIHLAALKIEDAINTQGLSKKIVSTQRLVQKSVDIVHRFARELRPTVLDDLGLTPALRSFLKDFTKRTKIPVKLTVFAGIEQLSEDKRTVIYRIVQAALNNVHQHAGATRVAVGLRRIRDDACLKINDNGKSFDVESVLYAKRHKRLGVLGMRERVEMVGGVFGIKSVPGRGTTVTARIPIEHGSPDNSEPSAT